MTVLPCALSISFPFLVQLLTQLLHFTFQVFHTFPSTVPLEFRLLKFLLQGIKLAFKLIYLIVQVGNCIFFRCNVTRSFNRTFQLALRDIHSRPFEARSTKNTETCRSMQLLRNPPRSPSLTVCHMANKTTKDFLNCCKLLKCLLW